MDSLPVKRLRGGRDSGPDLWPRAPPGRKHAVVGASLMVGGTELMGHPLEENRSGFTNF